MTSTRSNTSTTNTFGHEDVVYGTPRRHVQVDYLGMETYVQLSIKTIQVWRSTVHCSDKAKSNPLACPPGVRWYRYLPFLALHAGSLTRPWRHELQIAPLPDTNGGGGTPEQWLQPTIASCDGLNLRQRAAGDLWGHRAGCATRPCLLLRTHTGSVLLV